MKTLSERAERAAEVSGSLNVEQSSLRAATLVAATQNDGDVANTDERRANGLRRLHAIKGVDGRSVIVNIRGLAPDLADWLLDYSFDAVLSRPGLDFRIQQLTAIAASTARRESELRLEIHVRSALDVGCTRREIIEVILQMTACAGITGTLIALRVARRVFESG